MRILWLHPGSWGGEYALVARLAAMGHEVCVLEEQRGDQAGQPARRFCDHFQQPGDRIATLWYDPHRGAEKLLTWPVDQLFKKSFEGRNLAHRMWLILAAVRHFRPDVIMCSDGFTYAIPAAFLKRLGMVKTRLVSSYIGGDILDCPEYGVGKRRTPMISWLIRNSLPGIDLLRPQCPPLERILIREGADQRRIVMWPCHLPASAVLLDAVHARRAELSASLRARYGIVAHAPLVMTISGNHKGKGLHHLAAAWPAIAAAVPGCRWLLCGPPHAWLDEAVKPLLAQAGLQDTVHYTGWLAGEEVFEHMAAADLHVNPTLCEGLNMVTVEAAAVGTPSITSDAAGIAEWVEAHDAGLVVPAADIPALAEAVIAGFSDGPRRLTWGTRSRTMAGDFSLDRIADGLLRLFEGRAPA